MKLATHGSITLGDNIMAYVEAPRSALKNLWNPNATDYGVNSSGELTGGYGQYQSPFFNLKFPESSAPLRQQANAGETAAGIGIGTASGIVSGAMKGGWVSAIVSGVLGLAEGIIGAAVGSAQAQRTYNQQLQAFDNQMRYYYEAANNAIEEIRRRREEAAEEKAYSRKQLERKMKLNTFLFGEQLQDKKRLELSQRWK